MPSYLMPALDIKLILLPIYGVDILWQVLVRLPWETLDGCRFSFSVIIQKINFLQQKPPLDGAGYKVDLCFAEDLSKCFVKK